MGQKTEKMQKYEILNGKQTTDDYPYGRLRCTRTTEIEFAKGKGFRIVHQTINPKNGRLNAPKKSTYYPYLALHKEPETGHTKALHFSLNGLEEIKRFIDFLRLHTEEVVITDFESQELWATIITSIRIGAGWTKLKDGYSMTEDYLPATRVAEMIKMYGNKENIRSILNVGFDIEELKRMSR